MTSATGPLADLLIVDLSRVLAGPYCTMVLADLGARVVKVEQPGVGDDSRHIGPFSPSGQSAYFSSINRGKESIALDLKAEADRATFEALMARADVVVENYRPGVMTKLGYGWDALHARYPRLIYAAASGFGHTGPDSKKAAYDMVVQAMGGIMSITGWPGGPPTRVGTSVGDITAGLFTVIGILSAVHHREKSGEGQFVDVAMLDGQIAILENAIARYAVTGVSPGPLGARHPSITPFAAYACADGFVVIAAGNDALWGKLSAALGLAPDARFASNASRTEHAEAVAAAIEAALAEIRAVDALALCEAAGIPCGPLHNTEQALNHRQVRARNMVIDTAFPDGAPLIAAGNPVKLSAHPDPATRTKAPLLDEHRAAILAELGLPMIEADIILFAEGLADAAGAAIRPFFRRPFVVETKPDQSPVTGADRAGETAIRALIEARYPDHGIIGEEFGSVRADARCVWVLDPIDGTRAFIAGRPIFGTLIALLDEGRPVLGIIDQPIAGDRWVGAEGRPTLFNGMPAKTRACPSLATAHVGTTSPHAFHGADFTCFEQLRSNVREVIYGGDCHNYGLLASGWLDLVVEASLKLHDFAALVPVVEGAGGAMRDWSGQPLHAGSDGRVIAAGDAALLPLAIAALSS